MLKILVIFSTSPWCATPGVQQAQVSVPGSNLKPGHFKQPFARGLGGWLATLQYQGRLWQMTELHLTAIKDQLVAEDSAIDGLTGVLLNLSTRVFAPLGHMPLQVCHISGPFDVMAVRLLPAGLLNLRFHRIFSDYQSSSSLYSSLFGVFKHLQTLSCNAQDLNAQFCMNSVMPCLRHLNIPNMSLHLAPGCNVAQCLPQIVSVVAEVPIEHGRAALVQDLLQVASTLDPQLDYISGPKPVKLSMQKSSPLRWLRLRGNNEQWFPQLGVIADVQLCKGVYGFFSRNINVRYED